MQESKSLYKRFFSCGHLNSSETVLFLKMIDDRNLTSYTYKEVIAEEIFSKLEKYIEALEKILAFMKKNV